MPDLIIDERRRCLYLDGRESQLSSMSTMMAARCPSPKTWPICWRAGKRSRSFRARNGWL